jgi:hypothetical protein
MTEKRKSISKEHAAPARSTPLAEMSVEERREVQKLVQRALDERNLPRFKASLLKLGYDETSDEYEKLLRLWDEHARASRYG